MYLCAGKPAFGGTSCNFEASRFARPCEVSRTTVASYLAVLDATFVAHVVRPFSTHRATEITSAPKVYGFDTGFVCYYRGWSALRREDFGVLWEHFVLNELHARLQSRAMNYWRDKRGHEVDFVLARRQSAPVATHRSARSREELSRQAGAVARSRSLMRPRRRELTPRAVMC